MSRSLKIAVADDEADMRDYFARILPRLGHEVVVAACNGREFVERCYAAQPDLLIVDIEMPELDGIAAAAEVCRSGPVPVILVSGHHDPETLDRADDPHIMAYLVKPIKQADLEPAIALAMRRFAQFETLRREATDLRQALEERKLVERAKGILMKRAGLDEQEAFRRMQKMACDSNRRLAEIAESILTAETAAEPPKKSGEK